MNSRLFPAAVFALICVFSCSNSGQIENSPVPEHEFGLPLKREMPVLRILDTDEGAALAPWFRSYMENGIAGPESLVTYQGSYLFIASMRASRRSVIDHWMANYVPTRDFPRLVAARIQKRLELDLPGKPPDLVYGPNYEKTLKSAYRYAFWGASRLDDTWVLGHPVIQDEGAEAPEALYWGFILLSVPRETLEIQVSELLSMINNAATSGGRAATKEQNAAFGSVKEHFFEHF